MRKSTKVIGIMALVSLGLGIVFTTIGGITCSDKYSVRDIIKNKGINLALSDSGDFDDREYTLAGSFEADSIEDIDIQLEVSALKISPSKDNKCYFYVEDDDVNRVSAEVEDGMLTIWDDDGRKFRFFDSIEGIYAKLELPEKVYNNIYAYVDLGCIYGEQIEVSGVCSFEVDAGYIEIDELKAGDLSLNCDMGNIEVTDIKADSAEFECNMGNIDVSNVDVKRTALNCDMGNIEAQFAGNSNEYNIEKNCDMGNIDVTTSKTVKENVSQKRNIDIDCDMGNIDVTFKE